MYAIKIYKDENRLLGPFATESDATAYRDHILMSPKAEIVPLMAPVETCLSIARQKALKVPRKPPSAVDD